MQIFICFQLKCKKGIRLGSHLCVFENYFFWFWQFRGNFCTFAPNPNETL